MFIIAAWTAYRVDHNDTGRHVERAPKVVDGVTDDEKRTRGFGAWNRKRKSGDSVWNEELRKLSTIRELSKISAIIVISRVVLLLSGDMPLSNCRRYSVPSKLPCDELIRPSSPKRHFSDPRMRTLWPVPSGPAFVPVRIQWYSIASPPN